MLRMWGLAFLAVWASPVLAAPASPAIQYVFTSDFGAFTFTSPGFFGGGNIPGLGGKVDSISPNLAGAYFRGSDILLITPGCRSRLDTCFDATFLEDVFQETGDFFASDGGAQIKISLASTGAPVPEPSTWALLMVGLAGLGFARNRRMRGTCASG
jgi:hypothetical protein